MRTLCDIWRTNAKAAQAAAALAFNSFETTISVVQCGASILSLGPREPNMSFRIFSVGQLQRNEPMKLAIALLAAGIGLAATAASAEETRIGVGVGPVGAGVTVGSGHDRDRDRDRTTIIKRDAEPRERTTVIKERHEEPDRKVIIKDRD
jgi:hypothetical protein